MYEDDIEKSLEALDSCYACDYPLCDDCPFGHSYSDLFLEE